MPLFVCDKCHCIENTALGRYWSRDLKGVRERGKALCSQCAPTTFVSGEKTKNSGKWHGKFLREKFDKTRHSPKYYIYIPKELL